MRLAPFIIALLALPALACGQSLLGIQERHAKVSLVSSHEAVTPGTTLTVGVRFDLEPKWHIYWTNPGDAGQAPEVTWSLPDGWKADALQYPTPIRFESGGLVGYGYAETIVLPVKVTVPADATIGTMSISASVKYLVCDDKVCVPESAEATLNVLIAEEAVTSDATGLAAAMDQMPTKSPADVDVVSVDASHLAVELPVGATDVGLFPDSPDNVAVTITSASQADQNSGRTTAAFTIESRVYGGGQVPAYPAVVGYTTADGNRRGLLLTIPAAGAGAAVD